MDEGHKSLGSQDKARRVELRVINLRLGRKVPQDRFAFSAATRRETLGEDHAN